MPRNKKKAKADDHPGEKVLEQQIQHLRRELALVTPPKVENKLVTVQSVIGLRRNVSIVNDGLSTTSWSGNGAYQFNNVSSTPVYIGAPQVDQLDLYFKLYKYWTPMRVKITVLPYQPYWNATQAITQITARPAYTCNDLDFNMGQTDFLNKMAAKGTKPFSAHPSLKEFSKSYDKLNRLALQKQQKELFLTNGSWTAREQLRNPACIQLHMVDPFFLSGASTSQPFVDIVYELQIMCSDRVDPNDPELDEKEDPQAVIVPETANLEQQIAQLIIDQKNK